MWELDYPQAMRSLSSDYVNCGKGGAGVVAMCTPAPRATTKWIGVDG